MMRTFAAERRMYNRVAFESVIKYSFGDESNQVEWRIGKSKDISCSGLRFESVEFPRHIKNGEKVSIKFVRHDSSEVCFQAQIRWCEGKQFGVQFKSVYTDLINEQSGLCIVNM